MKAMILALLLLLACGCTSIIENYTQVPGGGSGSDSSSDTDPVTDGGAPLDSDADASVQ